jgi:hypothetical protein
MYKQVRSYKKHVFKMAKDENTETYNDVNC